MSAPNTRITQEVLEVVEDQNGTPNVRVTQEVLEFIHAFPPPNVRCTQVVLEVVLARRTPSWVISES